MIVATDVSRSKSLPLRIISQDKPEFIKKPQRDNELRVTIALIISLDFGYVCLTSSDPLRKTMINKGLGKVLDHLGNCLHPTGCENDQTIDEICSLTWYLSVGTQLRTSLF